MKLALPALLLACACGDNLAVAPDAAPARPDAAPTRPGLRLYPYAIAVDVSPDGALAAFEELTATAATARVYDTTTGEQVHAFVVGDPSRVLATGLANTGAVSALHGEPVQAGLWTPADGWQDLGSPFAAGCGDADVSGGWDVSADGAVVVGLAWDGCAPGAFLWRAGAFTALPRLGTPPDGATRPPTNRATVVSDDGRVAAGFAENGAVFVDRTPAVWKADGTGVLLAPTSDAPGEVFAISADGGVVAAQLGADALVWSEAGGAVTLPRLDTALPSDPMFPNAITGDGRVVFGGSGDAFSGTPVAFVWDAVNGTRSLASVVEAAGLAVPAGTLFNSVLGVSADGTVLVGVAMDAEFRSQTFLLRLPASAL